jgi:hypothetical protein
MTLKPILILLLLVPLMLTPVFAQSLITFDVDTTKFAPGEIVELTGNVDVGLEGQPVAVEIKDADGNLILIRTVTSDSNGKFTLKFKVPSTAAAGEFDISTNIELDGQTFSGINVDDIVEPVIQNTQVDSEPISDPNCGSGTILKDGICVVDTKTTPKTATESSSEKSSEGGGCLIATATYGSEMAPEVQKLRELRDNSLLATESGTNFMNTFNYVYYSFSPIIADYERENLVFKEMVKVAITPMITSLSILNYVDMDSESSVLGYGISLIVLNLAMYVGIPVLAVMKFRK